MRTFDTVFLALALLVCSFIASNGVSAANYDTPATKDSTIVKTGGACPSCPEGNCWKCTRGHDPTLEASTGVRTYIRSLIGFSMQVDGSLVANCTLQIPAFKTQQSYPVTLQFAHATSSNWNEDTVTAENAPESGAQFATVTVPPYSNLGPVDITQACRWANSGQFSIYIGTQSGGVEFWSKDSGNPAILHITTYTLKAKQ